MIDKKALNAGEDSANAHIRFAVLVLLCCQNAGHALLTRYSRGVLKETYSSTEVVLVGEAIKFVVSGYLALMDRSETDAQGSGLYKLIWLIINSRKVVVLVVLYAMSNLLSYYALARVDASAYTVLLQLKILTTAGFAVVILGRAITSAQWRALLLLVLGCVLVASPAYNRPVECGEDGELKPLQDHNVSSFETVLGFGAILVMNAISGFASIYFESMLKKQGEKVTIWERNFQLAFCSLWLLIGVVSYDAYVEPSTESSTFFAGWTANTVMIALIQAGGGLLVAATLKYADSILKTLATSGSIVLSAIFGHILLNGKLDIFIVIGCMSTILAICNYTFE
mmetsp:Transcript_20497/g.45611  ORF Transcript_20497/g.45611 Transcript_20497/m.45611 type:complete len:340 (-) Transcript_20497:8-1027(-)